MTKNARELVIVVRVKAPPMLTDMEVMDAVEDAVRMEFYVHGKPGQYVEVIDTSVDSGALKPV